MGAEPSRRYQRHLAKTERIRQGSVLGHAAMPSVYFIQAVTLGLIKIGATADLKTRFNGLQVASPDRLQLLGAIRHPEAFRLEAELHARFRADHSHREWFRASEALLAEIAKHPMEAHRAAEREELRAAMDLVRALRDA